MNDVICGLFMQNFRLSRSTLCIELQDKFKSSSQSLRWLFSIPNISLNDKLI